MPLSAQSIANDCLSHIGVQITDPLPAGALSYLTNCLNQSLEEMRVKQPMMFRQTITVNFTGGLGGTINVAAGSQVCTLGTLAAPQNGCTIVIGGDSAYNEIRARPAGGYQLLVPYAGMTGLQSAICYGDSVVLDTSIIDHAIGAVLLHDRKKLAVLTARQDWLGAQEAIWVGDYRFPMTGQGPNSAPVIRRQPTVPEAIWLDTYQAVESGSAPEYKVRCAPLPNGNWAVDLDVSIIPTEVDQSSLTSGNFYFPVPGGRVYTIFRALALYHWSGSPFFANQAARKIIEQGYADAVMQLEQFRPLSGAQPRLVVRGYLG